MAIPETTKKTVTWLLGTIITLGGMFVAVNQYMASYVEEPELEAVAEDAAEDNRLDKAEQEARIMTTWLMLKNIQRGRAASYDDIPEEELSDRDRVNKQIIDYDLRNIEMMEQAVGLKTVPKDE